MTSSEVTRAQATVESEVFVEKTTRLSTNTSQDLLFFATFTNQLLDDDVLDELISCSLASQSVILEVAADCLYDLDALMLIAINLQIPISFLPPKDQCSSSWKKYTADLQRVTRLWLCGSSATLSVFPVSSYFQYITEKLLGYTPEELTADSYLQSRFVDHCDLSQLDNVKSKLLETIYAEFGGQDAFITQIMSTVYATTQPILEYSSQSPKASLT
jgi:hypothetical protein